MVHCFDSDVAKDIGIIPAILLYNLWYWCEHNRANGVHEHDGSYWTFNSISAFEELFPYLTNWQLRAALKKLEDEGYIKVGNYNDLHVDRTKWYTVTDKYRPICEKPQMQLRSTTNAIAENHKPIPYINSDINTDKKEENVIKEEKTEYGFRGIVKMLKKEHDKLVNEYGEDVIEDIISRMEEWCERTHHHYTNYYAACRKWLANSNAEKRRDDHVAEKPKDWSY